MTILHRKPQASRGIENDCVSRNNDSKVTMLDSTQRCIVGLRKAKTDLLSRRLCIDFQSDYISINGFNPDHVKGFVDRFKLISSIEVFHEIEIEGHNNSKPSYDSQWHIGVRNNKDKYFEAERFIYYRVHDDHQRNHNPTVIMMLVYLKAKKKHQETIMREVEDKFPTIDCNDDTIVVNQATVEKVKETNKHNLVQTCSCAICSLGLIGVCLGLFLSLLKIHF